MKILRKNLVIFTGGFPFGNAEVTFLNEETKILADHFDKILIIPFRPNLGAPMQVLPQNVEVINASSLSNSHSGRVFKDYLIVAQLLVGEIGRSRNLKIIINLKYHISELFAYLTLAKAVDKLFSEGKVNEDNCLFYSYWFYEWASVLSILKSRLHRNIKFISRAHGYDLYDERNDKGYIFPRHFQLSNVDQVVAISNHGKSYLVNKFPEFRNKITFSRLGIVNEKDIAIRRFPKNPILLVSCSSFIDVKRVDKIVDILKLAKERINWFHFGDGPLKSLATDKLSSLPENVSVQMEGNLENAKLLEFYSQNYVDWFINVSESEGIPVSIMEAISFGIPIIATDVGGVSEIVNEVTGVLIDKNFDPKEIISLIENRSYTDDARKEIVRFWANKYSAKQNYGEFVKILKAM